MTSTVEHQKDFEGLLEATGELIVEALSGDEYSALSSAAVLQSALLLEAAANCCIYGLVPNGKLLEEFDRLPSLAKFDLFLLVKTNGERTLDRGVKLYQNVKELKRLRDVSVHPKNTRVTFTQVDEDTEVGEFDRTPRLGISMAHKARSVDDAITSFKVVNAFLDDFFRNACGLELKDIRLLLLGPIEDGIVTDWFPNSEELEMLQERFGVPLSYAGIGVDPDDQDVENALNN